MSEITIKSALQAITDYQPVDRGNGEYYIGLSTDEDGKGFKPNAGAQKLADASLSVTFLKLKGGDAFDKAKPQAMNLINANQPGFFHKLAAAYIKTLPTADAGQANHSLQAVVAELRESMGAELGLSPR